MKTKKQKKIKKRNNGEYSVTFVVNDNEREVTFKKSHPAQTMFEAAEEAISLYLEKNKEKIEEERIKILIDKVNFLLKKRGIDNFLLYRGGLKKPINGLKYYYRFYNKTIVSEFLPGNKDGLHVLTYPKKEDPKNICQAIIDLYDNYLTDFQGFKRKFSQSGGKIYYS